ncbi:MAG: hypothetical protein ACJ77N_17095 [Chloroflexota bacterium]
MPLSSFPRPTRRLATVVATGIVAVVIGGCSSGSAPTPIPTDAAAAYAPKPSLVHAAAPAPSAAVSSDAAAASAASDAAGSPDSSTAAASPDSSAATSGLPSEDPGLEAVIPPRVSDIEVRIASVNAPSFLAQSHGSDIEALFPALRVEPMTSTVAIGVGGDPTKIVVIAVRFPGVAQSKIASAFKDRVLSSHPGLKVTSDSVDGHQLLTLDTPGTGAPTYVRVADALLVIVQATDKDLALQTVHALKEVDD